MPKKLQRKVAPKSPPAQHTTAEKKEARPTWFGRRITARVLAEFTTQLAVLLNAGIPVLRCLRILEGQTPPGAMKRTLQAITEDVESGTSLSESLAKFPRVFDRLYTNMVRAGEAGGVQDEILNRLASFLEKSEAIKSRVKGALAYPIAIILVAIGVLVLLFALVIPRFREIFLQQFRSADQMPGITQFVMNVGEHCKTWWFAWLGGALLGLTIHLLLVQRIDGYRKRRDALWLRVPLFGNLIRKTLVARFARTFGTLIQSGVPHLDALEIVRGAVQNRTLSDAVGRIHGSIREGAGIAVPMGESGIFDDVVVNMVDVGEQTGELDRMLAKIADRYEVDVDRTVETTFKVIEPILLVLMAGVVGVIALALFLPLLKLMNKIGGG